MKSLTLGSIISFITLLAGAQTSILGQWKTIDDNTGKDRSVVEITEQNGKFYGKVIRIFSWAGEDPDPVCDKCSTDDSRFNKKVVGMVIIQEMLKDEEEFSGGTILDPKIGKVYRCRIWRDGDELKVRGYLGPFFRTQTWLKSEH